MALDTLMLIGISVSDLKLAFQVIMQVVGNHDKKFLAFFSKFIYDDNMFTSYYYAEELKSFYDFTIKDSVIFVSTAQCKI